MKFLIIGLGSMGKRRIRNLFALRQRSVIGFDPRNDRRKESGIKFNIPTFKNLEDAFDENPDAMIISTPPDKHLKYAQIAISKKIPFFTEANVLIDDVKKINSLLRRSNLIGVPSCTLRFNPLHLKLKKLLLSKKFGKPLSIIYHYGENLHDWHPWEKITDYYVSKRTTGGGRESVPFELVGLTYLFGDVVDVFGKISRMELKIDDIYNFIVEFESGVNGNITVDVISKKPTRELKIITENGIIIIDWFKNKIMTFTKKQGWKSKSVDTGEVEMGYNKGEKPYVEELKCFIKLLKDKKYRFPYSFKEDLKILKILNAIEKSDKKKKRIFLNYKD